MAAPFTSNEENITCIKHLALEGRCALVTSFGLFKYMIMYSLIQFICIIILYTVNGSEFNNEMQTSRYASIVWNLLHFSLQFPHVSKNKFQKFQYSSTLGNFQFLYVDLIITTALAFTMGRQGPSHKLVEQRPSSSLLSMANVVPLIYQVILCAAIQIMTMIYLIRQPW